MGTARLFTAYQIPSSQRESRAALVPSIRVAVHDWRSSGYEGATETSQRLLRYWFESDHLNAAGEEWLYYYCQREAIETLIYLYEVVKAQSLYDLARHYDEKRVVQVNPADDRWARYVFKMATGSGKTKVMSLAIVWSYFNARFEHDRRGEYTQAFALIAPNVIVYQRLLEDFRGGAIFRDDPLIPPAWESDWQFTVVTRDDPVVSSTPGTLYLTNIHQLYDSRGRSRATAEPDEMTAVLGGPRPGALEGTGIGLRERMLSHDELMVLNDEGHHLHTDELEWSKVIERMDDELRSRTGSGLRAQLDFTATPKHENGALFQEIVVDYPIAQAVEDRIVKRAILGELRGEIEYAADNAADRHRDKLHAGIEKWREQRDALEDVKRNPLLFVMAENTKAADEVGDWLKMQADFSDESVLVIHTNRHGEIVEGASRAKQQELEVLREAARKVDEPGNPYRAIVSVLMLREGWDVRTVTTIVPLRAYSASSQILPEQTLGRGLRRMWPVATGDLREEVIVIEHEAFRQFWDRELEDEGFDIQRVPVARLRPKIRTVLVDKSKLDYEIEVPRLTPSLVVAVPDLSQIDVHQLPVHRLHLPLPGTIAEEPLLYTGRDMLTREVVDEAEFERDFPADPAGYLNVLTRLVLRECRLANLSDGFAKLAPLMKRYIEGVMFVGQADMGDRRVMMRLNGGDAKSLLFDVFVRAIRELSIVERESEPTGERIRVSATEPYPTTRPVLTAKKTVFNLVPCDSTLEERFVRWLDDRATDVLAFAKNEPAVHFEVPYVSPGGGVRYYRPDFLIRTPQAMYVLETKGLETLEVPLKDQRMARWCQDATALTGQDWRYVKVSEALFDSGPWDSLAELERTEAR
ncbi:MAG: DEAD/DEAH box helicase family protein [Chloroflexota bacterium]|nr:DEAD/DEAH box helicase family protein [Chloroflexota bacterium]